MKKVTAIFLSVIFIVFLTACGQSEEKQQTDTLAEVQQESTQSESGGNQTPDTNGQDSSLQVEETNVEDGFIRIMGGTFQMGSPDTESWRSNDETQHPVTISDFYIS